MKPSECLREKVDRVVGPFAKIHKPLLENRVGFENLLCLKKAANVLGLDVFQLHRRRLPQHRGPVFDGYLEPTGWIWGSHGLNQLLQGMGGE